MIDAGLIWGTGVFTGAAIVLVALYIYAWWRNRQDRKIGLAVAEKIRAGGLLPVLPLPPNVIRFRAKVDEKKGWN